MINKMHLIENIYKNLSGQRFKWDMINKYIFHNFSLEFSDVSEDDMRKFCNDKYTGDYSDIAWGIQESIGFFYALRKERMLDITEIICCLFFLFALKYLIDKGVIVLDDVFEKMFMAYSILYDILWTEDKIQVFQATFLDNW